MPSLNTFLDWLIFGLAFGIGFCAAHGLCTWAAGLLGKGAKA